MITLIVTFTQDDDESLVKMTVDSRSENPTIGEKTTASAFAGFVKSWSQIAATGDMVPAAIVATEVKNPDAPRNN